MVSCSGMQDFVSTPSRLEAKLKYHSYHSRHPLLFLCTPGWVACNNMLKQYYPGKTDRLLTQSTKNIHMIFCTSHIMVLTWYHKKYSQDIYIMFFCPQCSHFLGDKIQLILIFFITFFWKCQNDIYATCQKSSAYLPQHFGHIYIIWYWCFFVDWGALAPLFLSDLSPIENWSLLLQFRLKYAPYQLMGQF